MTDTARAFLAILISIVIVAVSSLAGRIVQSRLTHQTLEEIQVAGIASQGGEVAAR